MSAPAGWQVKRLDELGTLWSGSTPSSNNGDFWDGDIVWITPTDLSHLNTPYIDDSAKRITERGVAGCSTHLLPPGSIVLSSRAPIGYIAIPTTGFCTNQGCKSIELDDAFNSEFVYYAINFIVGDVKRLGEGTTFAEISKKALAGVELITPSRRAEQSKIAEVLSTVDRAIAQTEALIAKQQRIKTGLMQDLLTRGIDEHGNLRTEATHAFKDSPLGRIPVAWEAVPVKSLIRTIDGGWSPSCIDEPPGQGEWGVLKVSAVSSGIYQPSESKRLPSALSPIPALEVRQGDVLLCRANGVAELVGKCAYVRQTPTRLLLSDKTLRLQPILKRVNPYILSLLLGVHSSRLQIMGSFSGSSGQKNISQTQINSIQVPLPPLAEQERLVSVLEKSTDRIQGGRGALEKLRSLKTALMQDLLSGKVRVTPLLEQAEAATA